MSTQGSTGMQKKSEASRAHIRDIEWHVNNLLQAKETMSRQNRATEFEQDR